MELASPSLSLNFSTKSFSCSVCYTEEEEIDTIAFECGHEFCKECVIKGITCFITSNNISQLKCFHKSCTRKFEEIEILSLVSDELYLKYKNFLQTTNVENYVIRYCPKPSCSQLIKIPPTSIEKPNDKIHCTSCQYYFCYTCSEEHHPSFDSCRKYQSFLKKKKLVKHNSSLKIIEDKLRAKNCPSCNYSIVKDGGCNHVICRGCKHEFCWLCMTAYSKTHFYDRKSQCYLLQFQTEKKQPKLLKKLLRPFVPSPKKRTAEITTHVRTRSTREINITLMGGCAVGKTPFATQFTQNHFGSTVWNPTIFDSYRRIVVVNDVPIQVDINDYNGGEDFDLLREPDVRNCDAYIFVYSISNRTSFEKDLMRFYNLMKLYSDNKPLILVANMCDNEKNRKVSKEEGESLARNWGCPFFESSAKDRINVDECFLELIRLHRTQF